MLTFEPDGHIYRWSGRVVPSVTQALSVIERGFGFVDPERLEIAREFGRHVHKAIELFNADDLNEAQLDAPLVPYLAQWKQFLVDTGFKVEQGEEQVYHPRLHYAGTLDIRGSWRRKRWLIDLKSGAVPKSVGPQTAGYHGALPIEVRPQKRAALALSATGYRLVYCDDPADFSIFQSALNIYRYQHKGSI